MLYIKNLALLIIITGALAIIPDVFPKTILASAPIDKEKIEEAQAFFENGVDAFNAKKYDDAKKCFNSAVSCNPEYAEAYAKLGDTLEVLKEEELAYESYQHCIELINNMESLTPNQINLRDQIAKKTAKFRVFDEKFSSINKDFTAELLELSSQCMIDTDYFMAKEIYSLTLQVDKKNEEATKGIQKADEEIEKEKAKEEQSEKSENSQLAESFYKSGLTQMEQNDYETAITKFKKAIAYWPEYPEALFKLGEVYEKNKQPKESVNPYRRCYKLLELKPKLDSNEKTIFTEAGKKLDKLDINGKTFNGIKKNYSDQITKLAEDCASKHMYRLSQKIIDKLLIISPDDKRAILLKGKINKSPDSSNKMVLIGTNNQGYKEYRHDETGMVFVFLPKGQVKIDDCEITISEFYCAKYEITQEVYSKITGVNPSRFQLSGNYPVEKVSWHDSVEFCKKAGLRLLTESEWKYACRANTTTRFY